MRNKINEDLKLAMKNKDKRRLSTLRLINATIQDRDIAARSKGLDIVGDDQLLEILTKMIKQRRDSIIAFEKGNRPELATQEQEEIAIISEYLPKQLDENEIRQICTSIIEKHGSTGLKDMGRTIGELKKNYMGQMDFATASRIVKELLG